MRSAAGLCTVPGVLLALGLGACSEDIPLDDAPKAEQFTLVYSQNVNGEIEPCG